MPANLINTVIQVAVFLIVVFAIVWALGQLGVGF